MTGVKIMEIMVTMALEANGSDIPVTAEPIKY